jgi:hypothetical protein
MRRLVLCIIVLLAIFAVIRAYTQAPARGAQLSPGLIQVAEAQGTLSLAFGLMDTEAGAEGRWNVLPLRILYTSGDKSIAIGLNGFSFLLAGGVRVGKPVRIDKPVTGDVVSIGGKVTVESRVDGDVWAFGADIALGAAAYVGGNVVAIGGKVTADPRARAGGTVSSLPQLKLPYLGILASGASAPAVELVRELAVFALGALVVFLTAYFLSPLLSGVCRAVTGEWRRSLLTLVLLVVVVPVLVFLLVVSVFGIFFIPFLLITLMAAAFLGFFAIAVRLGSFLRKSTQETPLFVFTSGMLGLFIVKIPAFAGIALSLVRSDAAGAIGQILRLVSLGLGIAFLAYGVGSSLAYARVAASGARQ